MKLNKEELHQGLHWLVQKNPLNAAVEFQFFLLSHELERQDFVDELVEHPDALIGFLEEIDEAHKKHNLHIPRRQNLASFLKHMGLPQDDRLFEVVEQHANLTKQ